MTASHPHHIWVEGYCVIQVELNSTRYTQICQECNIWRHRQDDARWMDGPGLRPVLIHE